jgi:hypothetical protein
MDGVNEFYGQRTPIWVHRSDYEFVDPIDWGQIDKDRQEQIDNAFRYISYGRGQKNPYLSIESKIKIAGVLIESALPIILKLMMWIMVGAIGTFALDYFNVINLGMF